MFTKQFTYKRVLIFIFSFAISFLFKNAINVTSVLPLPFYVSLLYLGLPIIDVTLAFLIPYVITFNLYEIIPAFIVAVFLVIVFLIYKRKNILIKSELIAYSLLSSALFIFLSHKGELQLKIIFITLSTLLSFVFIFSSRVLFIKKFNYKLGQDELVCLGLFSLPFILGVINVFGIEFAKAFCIFLILVISSIFSSGVTFATSIVLSLSFTLITKSFNYVAIFSIYSLVSVMFSKYSYIISAFMLLLIEMVFLIVFSLYGPYDFYSILYTICGVVLYLFLPTKIFRDLNSQINNLKIRVLPKYAVNRARLSIANKLYSISEVFTEMQNSFYKLKQSISTSPELLTKMADEVIIRVCEKCPKFSICKQCYNEHVSELVKILGVGISKGKVSLIDLTNNLVRQCSYANSIIYETNILLNEYNLKIKELEDISTGKELICMQAEGIATLLKNMAVDYTKNIEYQSDLEKEISNNLRKKGVIFNEISVISDNDMPIISIVCSNETLKNSNLLTAIEEIVKKPMAISSKTNISLNISVVNIKCAPYKDATFGLAKVSKNGEGISGDTHSLTKLDEGRFLIALSDGMGSGIKAENTSSTAISLIESFYKAGLDSKLVLSIVNKVLAISTDDNFSAMDIISVNLYTMVCDFIKIGAPYSFILSDESVKIIEGSSLPLGILDDLSPSGCQANVNDGDTIIAFTDGISDAFSSSTDLIEYIRTLQNRNPQVIADNILNKALSLDGGVAKDDMTVIAVRIFKKSSHNPLE